MVQPRHFAQLAVIVTMGFTSACVGDLIEMLMPDDLSPDIDIDIDANVEEMLAQANQPTAKLTEGSKTDACRAELVGALEVFRDDQGLAIKIEDTHVDALFAEGLVGITYARDGVRHTPSFRFEGSGDQCSLNFFRREESKPGHLESAPGNYGTVDLTVCVCE